MNARFGRETWSLVVPPNWRAWHDTECATLVADEEIGALQISAAFKDTDVTDDDLREFASDHLEAGAKSRPVSVGEFVGFEICCGDDDTFWRQWYLRNGQQMLFVTYNCALESRGIEDTAVASALNSLSASGEPIA